MGMKLSCRWDGFAIPPAGEFHLFSFRVGELASTGTPMLLKGTKPTDFTIECVGAPEGQDKSKSPLPLGLYFDRHSGIRCFKGSLPN